MNGIYVEVRHADGFNTWYYVTEIIDAIIQDGFHFSAESNRTIVTHSRDEYIKAFGYGSNNPPPDRVPPTTCYHFSNISNKVYKILGTEYTNADARGR